MQSIYKLSVLFLGNILISILIISCQTSPPLPNLDFRQEMRDFVIGLSNYSKNINSSFIIIPQNGQEIISLTDEPDGSLAMDYIAAIDGTGREDLYYGYTGENIATPAADTNYMVSYLDRFKENGIEVLITDYCSSSSYITDSYTQNLLKNYISFGATRRDLDIIPGSPAPHNESNGNIFSLSDASNFLYIINPESYGSKEVFLSSIDSTNFDIIIMDVFFNENEYTLNEIANLQTKPSGTNRLIVAYMSIGEAEDYRYYWDHSWESWEPIWLDRENPDWEGNYKVRYWEQAWQDIIYGNNNSYLKKILDAGFDGVYLDIIDGFEYFEEK
jgi:cysteinyl-tRNA synthetase, unknown class